LQSAAAAQPDSDAVLEAQADTAMVWLRNLVVHEAHTFTEMVDPLTPPLYAALAKAKGSRAADICAHIGWAQFLKSRDNPSAGDPDAQFRKAIELDPQNVYGHAMLAHHLLQRPGNEAAARDHFALALASGRDRAWLRSVQLAGWEWISNDAHHLELARAANDIHQNGEVLPADQKIELFTEIYWFGATFDYLTNLISALPVAEHLATLNWLAAEKGWTDARPEQKFVRAELEEKNGDWAAALELYKGLTDFNAAYSNEVSQAIARCQLRVTAK
jgi:hypothetical protein